MIDNIPDRVKEGVERIDVNMQTQCTQVKIDIQSRKDLVVKVVKQGRACLLFCEYRFFYTTVFTGSVACFVCANAHGKARKQHYHGDKNAQQSFGLFHLKHLR